MKRLRLLFLTIALAATTYVACVTSDLARTAERYDPGLLMVSTSTETSTGLPVFAHWDRDDLPLLLVVDPAAEHWAPDIYAAAKWWNKKLGFTAFLYLGVKRPSLDMLTDGSIIIVTNFPWPDPSDPEFGRLAGRSETGLLSHRETGRTLRSIVFMTQNKEVFDDRFIAVRMVRHELGHVLGLAHDPFEDSLMFPITNETPYDVTDSDLEILRDLYCPPKEMLQSGPCHEDD